MKKCKQLNSEPAGLKLKEEFKKHSRILLMYDVSWEKYLEVEPWEGSIDGTLYCKYEVERWMMHENSIERCFNFIWDVVTL